MLQTRTAGDKLDCVIFRQLFDPKSSTYTYLVGDDGTKQAALVDPVYEQFQRDSALVTELGLRLTATLETHVHADHVTSAWLFRERWRTKAVVGRRAGTTGHDVLVGDGDRVVFGGRFLDVRETPGHTRGCVTYVLDDRSVAFTGDALLVRGTGRTDFQEGDAHALYRSVRDRIFTLPDDTLLYPGHDYAGRTVTTVGEERRYNPRLGGDRSEGDFVELMAHLALPHPKQIDVALPANLEMGRPTRAFPGAVESGWVPAVRTYGGVPEVSAEWLAEHLGDVRLIDVREPAEFNGELGHIRGAELVPLRALAAESASWNRDAAIVVVCRSGGRSGQATSLLERAGFRRVANLSGGMIGWRTFGLSPATE